MIHYCKKNLQEIKAMLSLLNNEQYIFKLNVLSGSTIAEHTRHIIEFYLCLMKGYKSGIINYDARERDLKLQSNQEFAIYTIDKICSNINFIKEDIMLTLMGNFNSESNDKKNIQTSSSRELAYCLEHSIHHQALIKIGLIELNLGHLLSANFGVAPDTIRYKENFAM